MRQGAPKWTFEKRLALFGAKNSQKSKHQSYSAHIFDWFYLMSLTSLNIRHCRRKEIWLVERRAKCKYTRDSNWLAADQLSWTGVCLEVKRDSLSSISLGWKRKLFIKEYIRKSKCPESVPLVKKPFIWVRQRTFKSRLLFFNNRRHAFLTKQSNRLRKSKVCRRVKCWKSCKETKKLSWIFALYFTGNRKWYLFSF